MVGAAGVGIALCVWRVRRTDPPVTDDSRAPHAADVGRAKATSVAATPARRTSEPSSSTTTPTRSLATRDELRERLAANRVRSNADLMDLRDLLRLTGAKEAGPQRDGLIQDIAAHVAGENPGWGHALLAAIEDGRSRLLFTQALVDAMVVHNPPAAAGWAAELSDSALRDAAYNVIGMKWGETDLNAARAWALELTGAAGRASAVEGVTWAWAQQDPKALYDWAVGLTDAALREQVLVKTAKMLAVQNPEQALARALQFPEGAQRDQALQYAVFHWAAKDLGAATGWAAKVPDATVRATSELAIARSWSAQEAQGATIWAATINDPAAQSLALKTTLRKWAEANPADAAVWIAQRESTPANDDLFRSVTTGLAETRPAVLRTWLQGVANPEWRRIGAEILSAAQPPAPAKGSG